MLEDPLQILHQAGIECPELEMLYELLTSLTEDEYLTFATQVGLDAAILALARLVAKYRWQRDELIRSSAITDWNREGLSETDFVADETAWIEARWEARDVVA